MLATLPSSSSVAAVTCAVDSIRINSVEEDDADYEELIPPENFAMIEKGLYRSVSYGFALFS